MNTNFDLPYHKLIPCLVRSLVAETKEQQILIKKTHSAVFGSKAREKDLKSPTGVAMLLQKIFQLRQAGEVDIANKLFTLLEDLEHEPEGYQDDAIYLLCCLSEDVVSPKLRVIGDSINQTYGFMRCDIHGSENFLRCQSYIPDNTVALRNINAYEAPSCHLFSSSKNMDKTQGFDKFAHLVTLHPGSGLRPSFSNSENNNLMGASCLAQIPFNQIIRGIFVLDLPDLPEQHRGLVTQHTSTSSSSTIEDEGYNTRPTTPSTKPMDFSIDWEDAAKIQADGKVIRNVDGYLLKMIKNDVDVIIDDAIFERCVRALLNGLESEVFQYANERKKFSLSPRLTLCGVRVIIFQRVCNILINVGSYVRELWDSVHYSQYEIGSVKEAFWKAMRFQISIMGNKLPDFERNKSLVQLTAFARDMLKSCKLFSYLSDIAKAENTSDLKLISEINRATTLLTGTSHLEAFLFLFINCCQVFIRNIGACIFGRFDSHINILSENDEQLSDFAIPVDILHFIRKLSQNTSLLRALSPNHSLFIKDDKTPQLNVLTSIEALQGCEENAKSILEKHDYLFRVDIALDKSESPELKIKAQQTRLMFFKRIEEEKEKNKAEIKRKKLQEFKEKEKAMVEDLERRKKDKDKYHFNCLNPFVSAETEVINKEKASLDNYDVVNANITDKCNTNIPTCQTALDTTEATIFESFHEEPTSVIDISINNFETVQIPKNLSDDIVVNVETDGRINNNSFSMLNGQFSDFSSEFLNNLSTGGKFVSFNEGKTIDSADIECGLELDDLEESNISCYKYLQKADKDKKVNVVPGDSKNTNNNSNGQTRRDLLSDCSNLPTSDDDCLVTGAAREIPGLTDLVIETTSLMERSTRKLVIHHPSSTSKMLVNPYNIQSIEMKVPNIQSQGDLNFGISTKDFQSTFIDAPDLIERSLMPYLYVQSKLVNRALLNSVISDHRLDEHIKGLRLFFLLYDGEFASALSSNLINKGPEKFSFRGLISYRSLKEALSQSINGNSLAAQYLTIRVDESDNSFRLGYKAPWPIDLIVTNRVLEKYSKVNQLLFDLRRKSASMNAGLWKIFKYGRSGEDSRTLAVVSSCIKEASHVLNAIRRYFQCQAVEVGWSSLKKDWNSIETLDDVFQAHSRYIDGVFNRCLLMDSASSIKKIVDQVASACMDVLHDGVAFVEEGKKNEASFMSSFRKFRDATKLLCIVASYAAEKQASSYLAMFDLEVDFNNFFKAL
ncbi:uncharacterized protein LOC136039386 isoform X2 [Artemia franciscana]